MPSAFRASAYSPCSSLSVTPVFLSSLWIASQSGSGQAHPAASAFSGKSLEQSSPSSMPSASCQETFSLSAASATAWMLCFDTPSDLAIALRDVPAASCCSISLALIFLAMHSSFVSLGHGRRRLSAAGGARRLVSAGGAEAQYGRCRKAITCYRPAGAEARQPQCQYGLITTIGLSR